jgi:AraC-like DNA-binding protein
VWRSGNNDPNHFEHEFKKAHGMTPLQYRAAYLAPLAGKRKESAIEKSKIL